MLHFLFSPTANIKGRNNFQGLRPKSRVALRATRPSAAVVENAYFDQIVAPAQQLISSLVYCCTTTALFNRVGGLPMAKISGDSTFTPCQTATLPRHPLNNTNLHGLSVDSALFALLGMSPDMLCLMVPLCASPKKTVLLETPACSCE